MSGFVGVTLGVTGVLGDCGARTSRWGHATTEECRSEGHGRAHALHGAGGHETHPPLKEGGF